MKTFGDIYRNTKYCKRSCLRVVHSLKNNWIDLRTRFDLFTRLNLINCSTLKMKMPILAIKTRNYPIIFEGVHLYQEDL